LSQRAVFFTFKFFVTTLLFLPVSMLIGYARVSTPDQNMQSQLDALSRFGCEIVYQEKKSGKNTERPQLQLMLEKIGTGDTVVICKLDRLGRSLKDLLHLITEFQKRHIEFISLQDGIDTSTAQGRLFFYMGAAFAEFEREIIRERTMAGLSSARSRGKTGGRPKGLSTEAMKTALAAKQLYESKNFSLLEICQRLQISKPTLYRYIRSL
jgi:DNA invertase Pin-like site-specific DNA recombinase